MSRAGPVSRAGVSLPGSQHVCQTQQKSTSRLHDNRASPVSRDPGIAVPGSRLAGLTFFHVIAFAGPARLIKPIRAQNQARSGFPRFIASAINRAGSPHIIPAESDLGTPKQPGYPGQPGSCNQANLCGIHLTNLLAFCYSVYGEKVRFRVIRNDCLRNCFCGTNFKLCSKFRTGKTISENLTGELDAANIKLLDINLFFNTSFFM